MKKLNTQKTTIFFLLFSFISVSIFAQKTIEASDIMDDIKKGKNISYKNATINGTLDFTFMDDALPNLPNRKRWWNNGGSNKIEKQIDSKISFINCTFTDNVLAYIPDERSGYTFTANFEDTTIFKNCTFEGKALFKYSEFESDSSFEGSNFNDDSTFKYAEFNKEISFKNTTFRELATFKYTEFSRNVSFKNAIFRDTATFKYTKFNDGVSFNNTNFEEDLNLKYTEVRGQFDITNMKVAYNIDSKYTKINGKGFNKYLIDK